MATTELAAATDAGAAERSARGSTAGLAMASTPGLLTYAQSPAARNIGLMLGASAVIAVMAGVYMWSQQPDYRVLFSNFSDKDGGAIVAALQQQNVPYRFAEGGGAILVPSDKVHDARLKLAAEGLPKGGGVGFELMENQKLGVSQFLEQVNFQRALEGEMARSIQSIGAVAAARVHLALPKASVFVRDQQKPTASVLLNLHAGRALDQQQVNAIVHLVASSVPDLPASNVTVVDQNGTLLSSSGRLAGGNGLDPSQLKYVRELQQGIVRRIESIITPIVGQGNVRAEATADVDFSTSEQAAESFKPNQTPNAAAVRSQQNNESQNQATLGNAGGIPGALSNQPPGPTVAAVNQRAAPAAGAATAPGAAPNMVAGAPLPVNQQRDSTINYEVDKTIRYETRPMGGIRRLSVAVVVNHKRAAGPDGKVVTRALTDAEKAQVTDLVREAMGYNKERGDTLNVVNSPFTTAEQDVVAEPAVWKRPQTWQLVKEGGKYLLGLLALLYLFFSVLRPTLRQLTAAPALPAPDTDIVDREFGSSAEVDMIAAPRRGYPENLEAARQLARSDPKAVANVVRNWVEQ